MRWLAQCQGGTKTGIEISITESLLERGECRFTSAVARSDVLHFEFVMKSSHDVLNV